MITRDILQKKLEAGYELSTVQMVIESKSLKRSQKGMGLRMYTMDLCDERLSTGSYFNSRIDGRKLDVEFSNLADSLYQVAQENDQPIRFQLMLKSTSYGGGHFSASDVEVSKEGVRFLNYDSAGLNNFYTSNWIYILFNKLSEKFPSQNNKCTFYRFTPDSGIQSDSSSCTIFSLDALFHLSKMDTFKILESRGEDLMQHDQITTQSTVKHGCVMDLAYESIPTEFSVLFRNIQSLKQASQLSERFQQHVINKKEETLEASISRHTGEKTIDYKRKLANLSVDNKREGYATDVLNAYDEDPKQFIVNATSRDIFTAIESGNLSASFNTSSYSPSNS